MRRVRERASERKGGLAETATVFVPGNVAREMSLWLGGGADLPLSCAGGTFMGGVGAERTATI